MRRIVSSDSKNGALLLTGEDAWRDSGLEWMAPSVLSKALESGALDLNGGTVLWLYSPLAQLVVDLLASGAPITEQALIGWYEANKAILDLSRRGHDGIRILNLNRIKPGGLSKDVLWGGAIDENTSFSSEDPLDRPQVSAINDLLTRYVPELEDLYLALEASSWLPAYQLMTETNLPPSDLATLCQILHLLAPAFSPAPSQGIADLDESVHQESYALKEERSGLLEENELLVIQLQRQQKEFRRSEKEHARLAAKLAKVEVDRKKSARQLKRLRRQLEDLKQSSTLLAVQLQSFTNHMFTPSAGRIGQKTRLWWSMINNFRNLRRQRSSELAAIARSSHFDREWYLAEYVDVREAGIDPLEHYYDIGWMEGRNPNARFDTLSYLRTHPELRQSGINPLLHFVTKRESEGLDP